MRNELALGANFAAQKLVPLYDTPPIVADRDALIQNTVLNGYGLLNPP